MRICELVQGLWLAGMEKVVVSLSIGLKSRGNDVSVYCYDGIGPQSEVLRKNNIDVRFIPRTPGIDWSLPVRIARFLRQDQIDLLHCHNDTAFFYGFLASCIARVPVVYTEHSLLTNVKKIKKIVHSFFFQRTSIITAVTEKIGERLINEEKAPSKRVHVIWNGIDGNRYRARCDDFIARKRAEFGIPPGAFVLGTVGRCSVEKNQKMLIELLLTIPQEKNCFLVIVGDGPLRPDLESYATEKGIGGRIRFTGIREDTEQIYPVFDVFVLSSNREGMPLAVIEAMASALPVVSTDVGGIKNIVTEGWNGYLVPTNDIRAMLERIDLLQRETETRKRLGGNGRSFFEKYLSEEKMIQQYEDLFERVVSP